MNLYWSIRRELWEHRSLYMAPLVVGAVIFCAFVLMASQLPDNLKATPLANAAQQQASIEKPFVVIPAALFITSFIAGIFYCLDAMHGERRDRSVLFWKSLPVSDRTTVLAKACIPVVVMPFLIWAIALATQTLILLLATIVLAAHGASPSILWLHLPFLRLPVLMLYGFLCVAFWHAPLYAWMLLVSAWAKRAAVVWALLPSILLAMFEKMIFRTSYVGQFLQYRLMGFFPIAFPVTRPGDPVIQLSQLTPVNYLVSPGLWLGLAAAALMLAGASWLRRRQEPI